jgi:hypothetical protein
MGHDFQQYVDDFGVAAAAPQQLALGIRSLKVT